MKLMEEYDYIDDVKNEEEVGAITEHEYKKCFEQWSPRLNHCIKWNGAYIEENELIL